LDTIWLGYNGLSVPCTDVAAVLHYQPALNGRIARAFGAVPPGIRAVIVTGDESYWPSRWEVEWIRRRLAAWRAANIPG
jgi:hypothetical protein